MKLILCRKCQDMVRLIPEKMRYCKCGKIFGKYTDDTNAVVSRGAILIGIDNSSLVNAVVRRTKKVDADELFLILTGAYGARYKPYKERSFNAFLIPKNASSVKKIRKSDIPLYDKD